MGADALEVMFGASQFAEQKGGRQEHQLRTTFLSKRQFLEHAQIGAGSCRLLWQGAAPLYPGAPVCLDMGFSGWPARFTLRGRAVRPQSDARDPLASGWLLEFAGRETQAFGAAVAFAAGRPAELGRRRAPRYLHSQAARIAHDGRIGVGQLLDLGKGGAFLAAPGLRPAAGEPLLVTLRLGLWREVAFFGRVAWVGPLGRIAGAGVEFVDSDGRARRWLAATLARVAEAPRRR